MSTTTTTNLRDRVNDLVKYIQNGRILDAMTEFYDANTSMQENNNPPTIGLAANVEREKQFLNYVKTWKSLNVEAVGIDEGRGKTLVQINFSFDAVDGKSLTYDQVAVQTWKNGKIIHEKFYYDTGGKK